MTHLNSDVYMPWLRHGAAACVAVAFTALLAALPATPAAADSSGTRLAKGREFPKVRNELFKAGWKPVISDLLGHNGLPANQSPTAGVMYDAGFVEVEFCSVSPFYCTFNYRRGNKCLQLITEGEPEKYNGRQYPLLVEWSDECFRH